MSIVRLKTDTHKNYLEDSNVRNLFLIILYMSIDFNSILPKSTETSSSIGGNPHDISVNTLLGDSMKQAELNKALAGGRRRRYRGGSAQKSVPVPQFSGAGDVNKTILDSAQTAINLTNDATWDMLPPPKTAQKGGKCPCMNGGKRKLRRTKRGKNTKLRRGSRKSKQTRRKTIKRRRN